MSDYFDQLRSEESTLAKIACLTGANGFFGQEALRFISIAGTIIENFCLDSPSVDERYITHILSRSLLENYFWLIYIFDDPAQKDARYEELINSFRRHYLKLCNESTFPPAEKSKLEAPDPSWAELPKGLDVSSMLAQVKNDYGERLNCLYFIYRIASFDTHGRNMNAIMRTVFGKTCSFPVLKLRYGLDLIANQYLVILQELRRRGEI